MVRKSPTQHASETDVGIIKNGNDSKYWIVLENNNIKTWYLLGEHKIYYTIDNGGKPYKIIVSDSNVFVFSGLPHVHSLIYSVKKYLTIFIGKNTKKYGEHSNGMFAGSSVLVESKKNEYVFIGNKIKTFRTLEPVVEFHSIMGNSSVVYPFALTTNYAYLMLYDIYLGRNSKNISPYDEYYNFDKSNNPKKNTYISTVIDIPKY
jgi:hypothetical protein